MKKATQHFCRIALACLGICFTTYSHAATFSGSASISASDPSGALSADPANNALTVSCWFRLSIPSATNLTENLAILMDRTDGNESANFSYEVRFNIFNGNIEFLARGASGAITNTLIARPYLDRWYHVAVVRQQSAFAAYVDGRQLALFPSTSIGNAVGGGLAIGGITGNSRLFLGDIVEVAVYQAALSQNLIQDRMFKDQRSFANLKGYYKLAYSTNTADLYRNFVLSPPSGTDPATKQGAGSIGFEETDQAGEQSIFDSRKNRGQDAIAPLSGAFSWSQTAFSRPTPGVAFDFRFGYSSATPTTAPADGSADPLEPRVLGKSWRQTFDTRIAPEQITTERRLILWDGSIETWNRTNATYYTRHREYRGELVQLPDFSFEWTTPERLVYHFQDPTDGSLMAGRLREIRDFNGNTVQIQWNEDEGYITNVVDTVGGSYRFKYNTALGLLTNLTFGQWQVNFAYDATNRLISKTLTNTSGLYTGVATTWGFQYDTNGLLARIIDPRGNTNILAQYDQYGRQTNQVDALGRATGTRYGAPANRQITRTDSGGFNWIETYDRKGHILAQQDPIGNVKSYTYDPNGNRISTTEPLGWTTFLGYDARANIVARTNALGEVTRWVIHPFFNKAIQEINPLNWTNFYAYDGSGNLTNQSDALGSLTSYTYSTNGLVLSSTDGNGNVSSFGYDTNGFLITQTDPATNTTTFTRNDVNWKLDEIDALGRHTAYSYDLNGNVVLTVDPVFCQFSKTYDANGNLLTASDAKANLTRFGYDAANQKTNMVDRTGTNVWQYTYTPRGKPERVVNPLGFAATNFYDSANRLVRVSDPIGNTSTNVLDPNGNLITLFDPLGQRWTKSYDRLNRIISETDPLGNSRQTTFDAAGRVKTITSPNNFVTTHDYDGRGRLTKWHDAEGFDWLYDYDGNANITNITDALGGHYVMAYGSRNERKLERNQDNKEWQYTYDELLRLKTQTDPNTLTRSITYDTAGRIRVVDFTSGRQDTYDYDDNNNLKALSRRVGGISSTTGFNYDLLDRVIQVTDPFYKTVNYGYDALSRVTSLVYPDGKTLQQRYDSLNRLTNQVDWAGRQMNYVYDSGGRLIRRSYPNGVVQTNAFDNAGRITALSYAPSILSSNSINLALTYAYDRNGNKTGGGERGTFAWPLPSLIDETARFTAAGRITNRVDALNATNNFTYQFDASGNMTNASGGGQSWTLTYDEDNRTTSIFWRVLPMTDQLVTNRYDALGRRVSRTLDAVETRYVLDLQGSMERVLCDTDGGGNITAWYVHGPDLCYKVDATNGLACYHADAQANIIALTDGNTNLVAQYAYTPYGRSLGSTNFQSNISNPYLFVGAQGVTEELPGLYFMRARYYSADAGVFLSTDPVKKVGPGWRPMAYAYADAAPLSRIDPKGEVYWLPAAAFIGWAHGTIDAEVENITRLAVIDLPQALGLPNKYTKPAADIFFGVKNVVDTVDDGAQLIAGGASLTGVGTAYFVGNQASKVTAKYLDPKFMLNSYDAAIYAIGNALGNVLYNQFGVGAQAPLKLATPSADNSMANKTAGVAAPKAQAANATSTKGASPSGGGVTTSSGGDSASSGFVSYTVKPGDTLGNIGYAYGTTASAIGAANGIQNLNLIYPGQVLTIPRR